MSAKRPGFGLAADLRIQGVTRQQAVSVSQLDSRLNGQAPTLSAGAQRELSSAFRFGGAFEPEVIAEVYNHDAAWAGAAQLVDGRIPGRCGGGGCNAPSCAWQYWNVGLPCNEQNLQAYLFQAPRFVWAQQRLHQLWLTPPTPWHTLTNQSISENSIPWYVWLDEVYKAMALLRWASNVRWELVASKIRLPFEQTGSKDMLRVDSPYPLVQRFIEKARPVGSLVPAVLMESPLTWAFQQAGAGYDPDCRPYKVNTGDGGDVNPLAWPLKVPSSARDFAPVAGRWGQLAPTFPSDIRDGRYFGYEFQCELEPGYQNRRPGSTPALGALLQAGRDLDPDGLVDVRTQRVAAGGTAFDRVKVGARYPVALPYDVAWPSPLMMVLTAKTRMEAYKDLQFGDVVSAGLSAWAEMLLAQPESIRGIDASSLEAMAAGIAQAQLNEAAAYVGAGFGVAATLATTIIPQPYGAIVGAVIAIIGAIVTALMGAAYDLGLARPDRPPCPAPPVLRMIEDPETGACDFDAARRGAEEVLGKTNAIVALIGAGVVSPSAWFPVLEALSARPPDSTPPILPPPDVMPVTPTWKYVAGGLAVGGVGLGLLHLLRR